MREDLSTEELYAGLSPEARMEAVRLATRLQAQGGEASGVVAAAREAGVEDRFLREAAARLGRDPMPERTTSSALSAFVAMLFFFAQGYAGAVSFGGVAGTNLWIPTLLAAVLGASLPRARNRVLAPLAVIATWLMVAIFYLALSRVTGWHIPEASSLLALRIAIVELVLAFVGGLVANTLFQNHDRRPAPL